MHKSAATLAASGPLAGDGPEAKPEQLVCPSSKAVRERLRAMAADTVASWKAEGMPPAARSATGLRSHAESIVRRAGADAEVIGWTMVTLVSEYWRDRLAAVPAGRRLLLLPDCPTVAGRGGTAGVPHVCGPTCGIATIWSAARDEGWVVESTSQAVSAIGALLTGQYDGVLGVARLSDLQKAFSMLPAFALPIAAVPYQPVSDALAVGQSCADAMTAAAIDVEWALGLLGVAGGAAAPVGDYLPLLREAAGMFAPAEIQGLVARLGMPGMLGVAAADAFAAECPPLAAPAEMSGEFLARGGKFLRPFVTLAAFDAVVADVRERPLPKANGSVGDAATLRESARAAALAIEIFHKASLVHDDIEDDDAVRYGRPTLHAERGVPSAINAGDYLLGAGYRIMAGLPGVDPATLRDAVAILADAHVRLARGQGAELWWRDAAAAGSGERRLSPAEALTIYGLKTSPAFEAAGALGIRLAGLVPEQAAAIGRYALHVGTGFQVLNDLKDWAGDVENDRRAAGDLIGGRPTLLWALALEALADDDLARLKTLAGEAGRREAGEDAVARAVAEARALYEKAGVVARATRIAQYQRRLAGEAVASCRLPRLREVLEFLLDLAVPEAAVGAR